MNWDNTNMNYVQITLCVRAYVCVHVFIQAFFFILFLMKNCSDLLLLLLLILICILFHILIVSSPRH